MDYESQSQMDRDVRAKRWLEVRRKNRQIIINTSSIQRGDCSLAEDKIEACKCRAACSLCEHFKIKNMR